MTDIRSLGTVSASLTKSKLAQILDFLKEEKNAEVRKFLSSFVREAYLILDREAGFPANSITATFLLYV